MLATLVSKYRHKGVLVDTNLLIGYLVGSLGEHHLKNCRATKSFTIEDFTVLAQFLSRFTKLVTTPHILTEVSNLAGRLPEKLHQEFRSAFKVAIDKLLERSEPSKTIATSSDFIRLGLADTAITLIAPGSHLVLTDELALYGTLQKRGVDVVNFNHLRFESWQAG